MSEQPTYVDLEKGIKGFEESRLFPEGLLDMRKDPSALACRRLYMKSIPKKS